MSKFFSNKYKALTPYTPGEQPTEMKYIKLNTNESPFPPSKKAIELGAKALESLELYPDPECGELTRALAEYYEVDPECVLVTNGSDEILNFAFMAFCDKEHPCAFADITYGFYKVFAELNGIPYREIPLKEDFTIDPADYMGTDETIFIANPNAPTGIALPRDTIEEIIKSNPNRIVVVDEAYVDFGGESCVPLTKKYDNLLVTQTFSKSRSMAGARLGYGIASKELICDMNTIKYSTNPYNINRATMYAGLGSLIEQEYTDKNCQTIIENREYTAKELKGLGFYMTDSKTNFLFAAHPTLEGGKLYRELKAKGILVRHFDKERISNYNRITIGTKEQMKALIDTVKVIMEEAK